MSSLPPVGSSGFPVILEDLYKLSSKVSIRPTCLTLDEKVKEVVTRAASSLASIDPTRFNLITSSELKAAVIQEALSEGFTGDIKPFLNPQIATFVFKKIWAEKGSIKPDTLALLAPSFYSFLGDELVVKCSLEDSQITQLLSLIPDKVKQEATSLVFRGCDQLSEFMLEDVKDFPNLRSIVFENNRLFTTFGVRDPAYVDARIQAIEFRELLQLKDLIGVKACSGLKTVVLDSCLMLRTLESLKGIPLENFTLHNCSGLSPATAEPLPEKRDTAFLEQLEYISESLKKLTIHKIRYFSHPGALSKFQELEMLDISDNPGISSLRDLPALPKLHEIKSNPSLEVPPFIWDRLDRNKKK